MNIDNTTNFTGLIQRGDKAINERYRPCTFHELIGNEAAKKSLAGWIERGDKRSKALMLTGLSGCVDENTIIKVRKISDGKTEIKEVID